MRWSSMEKRRRWFNSFFASRTEIGAFPDLKRVSRDGVVEVVVVEVGLGRASSLRWACFTRFLGVRVFFISRTASFFFRF